jgi:copper chaperone CopZ
MRTIILFTLLISIFACSNNNQVKTGKSSETDIKVLVTTNFLVSGMTCTGCENTITKGVEGINGVKNVKASYKDSLAIVSYDSSLVTPEQISQKIKDLGYQVEPLSVPNNLN